MEKSKIRIDILPNQYLNDDGTFNTESAVLLAGKIAGVCYDKEGFSHLENESLDKTLKRVDRTLTSGHHSVYDHISISFNMQRIPKILAMVINNEKQYTTSEKSARYTKVVREEGSVITLDEERLYHKWIEIFKIKIKAKYGNVYGDTKIQKLAQENARYLVTVFMPTEMIYTTTLRQINYIAAWMQQYINHANMSDSFEYRLAAAMQLFINELDRLGVLVEDLMKNEKYRELSLFGKNLNQIEKHFGDSYSTVYNGSFAQLAQAQRHRTLDYQLEMTKEKKYFIPPILEDDLMLVDEWLDDMQTVKEVTPQGEIVTISEIGKYYDFILKCKERLCTEAQLEIMKQTRETLLNYHSSLAAKKHPLREDIIKYTHGARCTFPDYNCSSDCKLKEGKNLQRKI